jgi:HD-GYP domain-containing protein (c-di-GMP phosphodiesterase class II)
MSQKTPDVPEGLATRRDLLARLLGISHIMVAETDLGALLESIIKEAARLVQAERATLYLVNWADGELISYIAQHAEVEEIRLPIGRGIAGHVVATGQAVNLADAYDSEHFDRSWDQRTGYVTRSVLCVPLRNAVGETSGALQALNRRSGPFTEADESMLTAFAAHAAIAIDNARLHDDLKVAFHSTIGALSEAVDRRDPQTYGHSQRVAVYSVSIGRALGLPAAEVEALECAATLHDVGKIGVPDGVLRKNGRLDDREFALMKEHARITREILRKCYFTGHFSDVPFVAGAHHERLDGSGYPEGLRGEQIPLAARILAVADVFDALTAFDRTYRPAMRVPQALNLLRSEAGTKLDRRVVDAFIANHLYDLNREAQVLTSGEFHMEYQILARGRHGPRTAALADGPVDTGEGSVLLRGRDFIPVGTYLKTVVHAGGEDINLVAQVVGCERSAGSATFDVGVSFFNPPDSLRQELQHLSA